jgi:hypothetical protein
VTAGYNSLKLVAPRGIKKDERMKGCGDEEMKG